MASGFDGGRRRGGDAMASKAAAAGWEWRHFSSHGSTAPLKEGRNRGGYVLQLLLTHAFRTARRRWTMNWRTLGGADGGRDTDFHPEFVYSLGLSVRAFCDGMKR